MQLIEAWIVQANIQQDVYTSRCAELASLENSKEIPRESFKPYLRIYQCISVYLQELHD